MRNFVVKRGDGAYRFGLLGSAFDDLFNSPWTSNFSNIMRTDIRDEEKHYALDVEVPASRKMILKSV